MTELNVRTAVFSMCIPGVWVAAVKRPVALKKEPSPWMSGDRQPRPLARLVTLRDCEAASL
jgi:hypothetical protein